MGRVFVAPKRPCLTVSDIDSQRMVLHIRQGKGARDRDVPPAPRPLLRGTRIRKVLTLNRSDLHPVTVSSNEAQHILI